MDFCFMELVEVIYNEHQKFGHPVILRLRLLLNQPFLFFSGFFFFSLSSFESFEPSFVLVDATFTESFRL